MPEKNQNIFKVEIDRKKIVETIEKSVIEKIETQMQKNMTDIEKAIESYFAKSFFGDTTSKFESALHYTVELAFQEGVSKAMEELNFKEIICAKTKELLTNSDVIHKLAEQKVKASLGLYEKEI